MSNASASAGSSTGSSSRMVRTMLTSSRTGTRGVSRSVSTSPSPSSATGTSSSTMVGATGDNSGGSAISAAGALIIESDGGGSSASAAGGPPMPIVFSCAKRSATSVSDNLALGSSGSMLDPRLGNNFRINLRPRPTSGGTTSPTVVSRRPSSDGSSSGDTGAVGAGLGGIRSATGAFESGATATG